MVAVFRDETVLISTSATDPFVAVAGLAVETVRKMKECTPPAIAVGNRQSRPAGVARAAPRPTPQGARSPRHS